jgi:hypothetical protein
MELILALIAVASWSFILTSAGSDAKAGKGARHRAPGLPRVRPSGTRPRRRADVQLVA